MGDRTYLAHLRPDHTAARPTAVVHGAPEDSVQAGADSAYENNFAHAFGGGGGSSGGGGLEKAPSM